MVNGAPSSSLSAAASSWVSKASAIVMLVKERRCFSLFCFCRTLRGQEKTLLRRSKGRKSGKRERVMEEKTRFCFLDPMRFVIEDKAKKVMEKGKSFSISPVLSLSLSFLLLFEQLSGRRSFFS